MPDDAAGESWIDMDAVRDKELREKFVSAVSYENPTQPNPKPNILATRYQFFLQRMAFIVLPLPPTAATGVFNCALRPAVERPLRVGHP